MKRIAYTCMLLWVALFRLGAQSHMREWLVAMPDSVMPLLTQNNRLDFIDFNEAKMEAVVTNLMDGQSRMEMLTDDFVRINYTRTSDVEMKLLPMNDTTDILCMVTTVKTANGQTTLSDSRIAFFDAQWRSLEVADYIDEPCLEDFRSPQQGDSALQAWSKIDIFFKTYHLCAEDTGLRSVMTSTEYLSKEDREAVVPYVSKEPLVYRWIDGKYTRYE